MAVFSGDTEEDQAATATLNKAYDAIYAKNPESGLALNFADIIRKQNPMAFPQFARGGYATKGAVRGAGTLIEDAIASARKLMASEPIPVKAPDPYVKGVNDRKPELEKAIKDFYAGNITRGEYDDIVRSVLPVTPYEFIPRPSPENLAVDALNAAKKDKYGLNRDIYQEGDPVAMRLDIPAYLNLPNSQWVNSIHDPRGVHPTTYDSASAARNVEFVVPENKARATGEGGPKAPYAVMRGENIPITADEAVAKAQDIMSGPLPSQWQQVGMDPRRHSFFYTRDDRMMPVTNADEVLQIGPVVYAKNPTIGDRNDFGYARGGYATDGYVDPEGEQEALQLARQMASRPDSRGYVDDPQSARHVLQPANVKEWNTPTWLESLKDYLAEQGPQTGTGRPTVGGERVASGIYNLLASLPVTGQIDAGQRMARDVVHGDYGEAVLNTLGVLPVAPIFRAAATEASPALRLASSAMVASPLLSGMNRPEHMDAEPVERFPNRESIPRFVKFQKYGTELPYRSGYGPGGSPKLPAGMLDQIYEGLGRLFKPGSGYVPPAGKPAEFKLPLGPAGELLPFEARPIPEIEEAAARYMKSIGREGQHVVEAFPKHDPDQARAIALAYEEMQHNPTDPRVKRAYDAMIDETLAQYNALKDTGIDFTFTKPNQPYAYGRNPATGYEDIVNRGRMEVFPTEYGEGSYGTSDFDASENPLLKRVGRIGDLPNATANDAFRVVHDVFGHYGPGNPFFRAPGEERAWMLHSKMYSPEARPAMTSETRGQNSWVNFGPYADVNKSALGGDTIYADQKAGLMPDWTMIPSDKFARGGQPTSSDMNPPEAPEPDDLVKTAMFTGKGSRLADMQLLKMAEDILRGGGNPLKETGWFKDPQGAPVDWRGATAKPAMKTEISDVPSSLIMDPRDFDKKRLSTAGEILSHPELFEAYPRLAYTPVEANPQINYRGHYSPSRGLVALRTGMEPDLFRSTLLHELQHGIQANEGFVPGGSPLEEFAIAGAEANKARLGAMYKNWLREKGLEDKRASTELFHKEMNIAPEDLPSGWWGYAFNKSPEEMQNRALELARKYMGTLDPVEAYKRIHGENEAYNVEKRLERGITPEQTRDVPPEDTATWAFDQTFQAPGR